MNTLMQLAAKLGAKVRVEFDREQGLWAVWDDVTGDIIAAANTRGVAIFNAKRQMRAWLADAGAQEVV